MGVVIEIFIKYPGGRTRKKGTDMHNSGIDAYSKTSPMHEKEREGKRQGRKKKGKGRKKKGKEACLEHELPASCNSR